MSNRVTPFRIFLLFATTIGMLIGLMALFPSGKINEHLHFFAWQALTQPGAKKQVDISSIIAKNDPVMMDDTTADAPPVILDTVRADTLIIPPAEEVIAQYPITFPEGKDTLLYPFFRALDEVRAEGKLIRILHYGDSQVEGDRITAELRHFFHTNPNFGGCGPGLLPVQDILQGRLSVQQSSSENWVKYEWPSVEDSLRPHRDYGLMSHYFRYIPYPLPDTSTIDSLALPGDSAVIDTALPVADTTLAWVRYAHSNLGYRNTGIFQQYKILYNHNPAPVPVRVIYNDTDTVVHQLPVAENFVQPSYAFPKQKFQSIAFQFEGVHSPDIYGITLDCKTGVAVDNIGLRGSAIPGFSTMDRSNLSRQLRYLNARLVILQFGVNVVPHVVDNYTYYERMFYRNLMALKKAAPGVPILVVGVSDMSRKEGLEYVSYPNITLIRDAQRSAAFRAGCAFWDLFEAMGGKNAMVSWVHNDPPLAADDYTHFTARGARIVGKMMYDAIVEKYYAFKKVDQL